MSKITDLFCTWDVIAQASTSEGLKSVVPEVPDLKAGTIGRVTIEGLPWQTARMFDLWGAEQFSSFMVPAHASVIDVHEENGVGIIEFEVTGSPAVPILVAIAAALIALGIAVALISVSIQVPKDIKWIVLGSVGIAVIAFIIIALIARKT